MYHVSCDNCGAQQDYQKYEMEQIKKSGRGGPYCSQCGVRILKDRITYDDDPGASEVFITN